MRQAERSAVVMLVIGWSMTVATAAMATSCAAHEHATPQAIAEGTEGLATGESFREQFDGAVLGTVISTSTREEPGPDYGRTEVLVQVTGWFGRDLGSTALVVEPDPGWMNGYGLQTGRHYFIPYRAEADGLRSHVCDPITEIDEAEVVDLVVTADQHAWPGEARIVAVEGGTSTQPLDGATTSVGRPDARRWAWPLIALVLVAGGAAPAVVRAARGRSGMR